MLHRPPPAMDAKCNICGGPLSSLYLCAWQSGEDDSDSECYEEDCICARELGPDQAEVYDGDSERYDSDEEHVPECNAPFGFDREILSKEDIAWLNQVRVIYVRNRRFEVSPIGEYDVRSGLTVIENGRPIIIPREYGIPVHANCLTMLYNVHQFTRLRAIDLQRLGCEMARRWKDCMVNWDEDKRLFGDDEVFKGLDWVPIPGYDWLVANPMIPTDFSSLILDAGEQYNDLHHVDAQSQAESEVDLGMADIESDDETLPDPDMASDDETEIDPDIDTTETDSYMSSDIYSEIDADETNSEAEMSSTPEDADPFTITPGTFQYVNLNTRYWHSMLSHIVPWIAVWPGSLHDNIFWMQTEGQSKLDHGYIMDRLVEVSSASPPTFNRDFLGLRNRARIWNCCEAIIQQVGV
ncbi:hypothetical protein BDW62DRAFT_206373 [Aspergillus aurantiobrunneus]